MVRYSNLFHSNDIINDEFIRAPGEKIADKFSDIILEVNNINH